MTEETPKRRKLSEEITCDDCGCAVRLTRDDDRTLELRCACDGEARSIKVASALPVGWSDE